MRHEVRLHRNLNCSLNENKENVDSFNVGISHAQKIRNLRESVNPLKPLRNIGKQSKNLTEKDHQQILENAVIAKKELKISSGLQLKRLYSQQICKDYTITIVEHLMQRTLKNEKYQMKSFLQIHGITGNLRSKMVDWMIEVLSSYKMSQQTFFRSVSYMDHFFKHHKKRQQLNDLHLIGISSMFLAAKYQQIYPFRLKCMYEKIARKKFSMQDILSKQSEIIGCLDFNLQIITCNQLIHPILHKLSNQVLEMNRSMTKYLYDIVLYLSKMTMYDYHFVSNDSVPLLSGSILFIGLKTLEQVNKELKPEEYLGLIAEWLWLQQDDLVQCSRRILNLAKNFSTVFPGLSNLRKFNKFEYKISDE